MKAVMRSGLGRTIDPGFVSNRIAVIGAAAAGLITLVAQWASNGSPDLFGAGAAGVGVFLAWAIARELDPDHSAAATLAIVVAIAFLALGPPAAAVTAVVLLAARVTAGTVGTRLQPTDLVVLTLATAYAGSRPEAWGAAVFLLAAVLIARPPRSSVIALVLGTAAISGALLSGATPSPAALSVTSLALVAAAVVAAAISIPVRTVSSPTDSGTGSIDPLRITAARIGTAGAIVVGVLVSPEGGALALAPAVAALIGVAVVVLATSADGRLAARTGSGVASTPKTAP